MAQVVFHGVKVVEVGVVLRVHQDRGEEEDGECQVEVEREEGEVKERRSCMKREEERLKNILSHEVRVTQTSRGVLRRLRAPHAVLTGCSLRVSWFAS